MTANFPVIIVEKINLIPPSLLIKNTEEHDIGYEVAFERIDNIEIIFFVD